MKKIFYKYIVLFLIITFTVNLFHHIFTVVYAEHINISNDEGFYWNDLLHYKASKIIEVSHVFTGRSG